MTAQQTPAAVAWWAGKDDSTAHGFSDVAWMRSLCGDLRWNAGLEPAGGRRRCSGCELLVGGVTVRPVVDVIRVDFVAKRRAIAKAVARRRWRRTT